MASVDIELDVDPETLLYGYRTFLNGQLIESDARFTSEDVALEYARSNIRHIFGSANKEDSE